MINRLQPIPHFATVVEERGTRVLGNPHQRGFGKRQQAVLPNLKPTTQTISLHQLETIKSLANVCDAPYQSLSKVWLQEMVDLH